MGGRRELGVIERADRNFPIGIAVLAHIERGAARRAEAARDNGRRAELSGRSARPGEPLPRHADQRCAEAAERFLAHAAVADACIAKPAFDTITDRATLTS